jgi:hypothetical protein
MIKTAITTKVDNMVAVQRALEEVKKELDFLRENLDTASSKNENEAEGRIGSLRIIDKENDESILEIKTKGGWKKLMVGETVVQLKKLKSNMKVPQKKSIDEIETDDDSTNDTVAKKTIFDEKAGKFVLPRPDYDSGWTINASDDAATTLEHSLNTTNFSMIDIQVSNSSTGSNATWLNAGTNLNDANRFGYIVQVVDSNNVKVGVGQSGAAKFHCDGMEWENAESTHFRLRLWK